MTVKVQTTQTKLKAKLMLENAERLLRSEAMV